MNPYFCPPTLFLIFNRPNKTQKVFDVIKEIKPTQLFIAADGPRMGKPDDIELCKQTRAIINQIDWDCDVRTLFRKENLGCKHSVQGALDWFFEHVEEGIILEDDCVPDASFFLYCTELLDKYRDNKDIFLISGRNNNPVNTTYEYDYYFSKFAHIWGWATWKRSWNLYDREMNLLTPDFENYLIDTIKNKKSAQNLIKAFHKTKNGEINTWDYQLSLTTLAHKTYSIIPKYNLIKNIGFDSSATHTKLSNLAEHVISYTILVPLNHPEEIILDKNLEQQEEARLYTPSYKKVCNLFLSSFKKLTDLQ